MTEIPVTEVGGTSLVCLPRRIDVTNTQALVEAVRARPSGAIILDFSRTEAIDSTALGAIVQLFKQLRSEQRDLRLAMVSDAVRRVFAITRLDRVFDMYETTQEAIEAGRQAS